MNIIKAGVIYFALMFTTAVGWFAVWVNLRTSINDMTTAVGVTEATNAVQGIVTGANVTFFAAMVIWTIWFAYAAHSRERETSYKIK